MSLNSINDQGIILEIIGFILLLLTANRNPKEGIRVTEGHEENPFDSFRKKIIPDKHVHWMFFIAIVFVIIGLIWQFSIYQN